MYQNNEIIEGMARALFVSWYADEQEERALQGKKSKLASAGQDWMNIAPKTPRDAYNAAWNLAGRITQANGASLFVLAAMAATADCVESIDENDFGHYLAMEALGHGVSWFDNHEAFKIVIPSFDYSR